MRKVLLSLIAAVALSAGFTMTGAKAAVPVAPSALVPSITDNNLTEDVQWRRRCWHRWQTSRVVCRSWGAPRYYWGGRRYWGGPRYHWGGRGYWRGGWRGGRYWRR
jgi:hypothetical protein